LIGLLGILVGEQVIPVGKKLIEEDLLGAAWEQSQCTKHLFGSLPVRYSEPERMHSAAEEADL
jgi:xanthosine utilization system XapX-like protein